MDKSRVITAETRRQTEIEDFRRGAWLEKPTFILGLKRLGIISAEEAKIAARGDWPDAFAAALDALPQDIDPDEAQIIWAGISRVWRADPTLEALRVYRGIPAETLDRLFGWQQS